MTSQAIRDPLADHLITPQNSAFLLIDCQPTQFATVRSMDQDLLLENIVSTVKTVKAFGVPIVHSTVNVAPDNSSRRVPSSRSCLQDDEPLDRTTMNSWEDVEFVAAVRATGRRETHPLRAVDRGLHGVRGPRCPARGLRGVSRRRRDRRHLAGGSSRRASRDASRPERSRSAGYPLPASCSAIGPVSKQFRRSSRSSSPTACLKDSVEAPYDLPSTFTTTSFPTSIGRPRTRTGMPQEASLRRAGVSTARSRTSTRPGSTSRSRRSARLACTSATMRRRGCSRAGSTSTSRVIKRDRPDRFGAFAALPLPDVDGSLDQIEYALDVLELDGVSMMTNAGGSYLGDSRFDPIFAELQRRAAVVFVHPTASPDPIAHTLGLPDTLLDYPVDTSRAIAKLHYSNTFARTPDVKYVFVHAGGTIPFLASRFAIVDEMDVIPGAQERGAFADALPRLYWDTASAFSDPCFTCCDPSPGSETSCSEPIIRIPATRSRSVAYVSFQTPLSSTTANATPFWVGRPLG